MDSAGDLRIFLRTLIGGGVKKIAVDMTGLDFIASSGIGVLIAMRTRSPRRLDHSSK